MSYTSGRGYVPNGGSPSSLANIATNLLQTVGFDDESDSGLDQSQSQDFRSYDGPIDDESLTSVQQPRGPLYSSDNSQNQFQSNNQQQQQQGLSSTFV